MKVITLDDETYRYLVSAKLRRDESFSSVIKRHFGPGQSIEETAGGWADMEDEEVHELRQGTDKTFGSTLD